MATVVKISVKEQARLKRKFSPYGAKKALVESKTSNYPTINKLIRYREATDEVIANLSAYLGYDLELEQDKIPA